MIEAYRLNSSKYPPNSGRGAAIHGGRWNRPGFEAIYTAASHSLAVLEILVHYRTLPRDFAITPIRIPESLVQHEVFLRVGDPFRSALDPFRSLDLKQLADQDFTRKLGTTMFEDKHYAVLSVPSAIIPAERNYVLNPAHPRFPEIEFRASEPFYFDPRLKATV